MPLSENESKGKASGNEDSATSKAILELIAADIRKNGVTAEAIAHNVDKFGCIRDAVDDAIHTATENIGGR